MTARNRKTTSVPTVAVRGDLHVHTPHRHCSHPAGSVAIPGTRCGQAMASDIARIAKTYRGEYVVIANHLTDPLRPRIADRVDHTRLLHFLTEVVLANASASPRCATVLAGVEAHILQDGSLDIDQHVLAQMDIVIASRHAVAKQSSERAVTALIRACQNTHIDMLGEVGTATTHLTPSQWERLFRAAKATHTAIEVSLRNPLPPQVLVHAASSGCLLALGSDSHDSDDEDPYLDRVNHPSKVLLASLAAAGIKPYRILNTWPLPLLERWLRSREAPRV